MRAYYYEKVSKFINTSEHEILGQLLMKHNFSDDMEQKRAWAEQISILKQNLFDFPEATLFFEFSIPRMGKRVDNILLLNGIIYLLEFKISAENYHNSAIEQVVDYALDLKNFHSGSHNKTIVPILISTKAKEIENEIFFAEDKISNCLKTNATNFGKVIKKINIQCGKEQFNVKDWMNSSYKPTPTIIEAGQALYANHTVEDISRHGAEAINLTLTKNAVNEIIKNSKTYNQKSICFITGVPGAGKTLAGLDIATHSKNHNKDDEHACFLSGNGPLVNVLKEALIRNNIISEKISKKKAAAKLDSFIQNIHHFRDEYVENLNPPSEKIIIFDEAQRAWNKEKTSKFMDKKHKLKNFEYSEPELLIGVMDRHPNWCVIVCLIGEGQEINTGEAGLEEWFKALNEKYPHWEIYCSSNITPTIKSKLHIKDELHLNVSLRSFKSAKLSEFISNLIDNKPNSAKIIYQELFTQYPIYLTRNLTNAKQWVRNKARGTERIGILTHSNAIRLKPEGIFVKSEIDCINWFLNNKEDIRSSYALEDCATEFDVQGLELDWTIVGWDANLRYNKGWEYLKFSGTKWKNIKNIYNKKYLLNSYRVLLTRARQGMIIFVPNGNRRDETRQPEFYNGIYTYLKKCGIKSID